MRAGRGGGHLWINEHFQSFQRAGPGPQRGRQDVFVRPRRRGMAERCVSGGRERVVVCRAASLTCLSTVVSSGL